MKAERALVRTVNRLADRPAGERRWVVRRLTMPEKRTLDEHWPAWRHDGQGAPAGPWTTWTIMAGRGFGKTRAGAEWVSELARREPRARIALVGATIEDAVKVMVLGRSGLRAVARTGEEVRFNRTAGEVRFASGATAFLYSGACPEKLRGPEHHFAWCDEIAKWRAAEETWDNLQLGMRLGAAPRTLVTTTPKAVAMVRRLVATSVVTRGRTADNLNLPAIYVERMEAAYRGTRKGREELDGELIEDVEGALWTRALVERCRVKLPLPLAGEGWGEGAAGGSDPHPPSLRSAPSPASGRGVFARIVVGVDPPGSAEGDACGIVACGLGHEGIGYVLGDHSVRGLSPEGWAAAVSAAAEAWGADCVIVEKNQGGDMVRSVLAAADVGLPVRPVHARFGKGDRAEPVAMLFESGRARFAGSFPELEDELCAMTRGGGYAEGSPDRADAMVWAMTELMLGKEAGPPRVVAL
ncbi:MAG: DNA-packaging protein [Allosphingosinicella sp.]|uniref:DNA-packaging protein n=1 Tax=Allosphingosinicella sp. TaxID=2823234 RepID=UPI00393DDA3E